MTEEKTHLGSLETKITLLIRLFRLSILVEQPIKKNLLFYLMMALIINRYVDWS